MRYLLLFLFSFGLMAQRTLNDLSIKTNLTVLGSANLTNVVVNGYSLPTLDQRLLDWASGQNYQTITIQYNSNGVTTNSSVVWPDGSLGSFTAIVINSSFLTIDSYSITHLSSGKTIIQPTVSRNQNGSVTNKPLLNIL